MKSASLDIVRARRDTPGCERILHFNNAGASLMPQPVLEAMVAYLQEEALHGGYETAAKQNVRLEGFYTSAARLLNCQPEEIAFVENATRAWDMAFYSIPFRRGDRILTSQAEYASNFIPYLQVARRCGAVVEVVPNDESGQISVGALRQMINDYVKLIAITHVPTNGGLVQPAAAIGAIARQAKVLYLLDACQSVGQMPIDVQEIQCDFLSVTGRKFLRGPRGTGLLYVRQAVLESLEPPLLDLYAATWISPDRYVLRPDARRFENWEMNYAGKLGLATAIDYALDWGLAAIEARVTSLADLLRERLAALPAVTLRDLGRQQCAIVSFTLAAHSPKEIQQQLAARAINVSVSPREYTLLDMQQRGLESLVRASVHYYNTESEIERFVAAVADLTT
jgi:cysteine desulfurase/selenocysteine lyase